MRSILFFATLGMGACQVFAASSVSIPAELESATLRGDWREMVSLSRNVETAEASLTIRMLKGHANLVLNRCNEATELFFLVGAPEKFDTYHEWATALSESHPQSALSHYFHADSLARLGRWDDAIKSFDAALQIDTKLAIAYNARGVVHAMKKQVGQAKSDFLKAVEESHGKLADAYANLGFLCIQRKEGARSGAMSSFNSAIALAPNAALWMHGRGCVELINRDEKAAEADLTGAHKAMPALSPLFLANESRFAALMLGQSDKDFLAELSKAGTTIATGTYKDAQAKQIRETLNLSEKVSAIPVVGKLLVNLIANGAVEKYDSYRQTYSDTAGLDTRQFRTLKSAAENMRNWNRAGGGSDMFTSATQGLAQGFALHPAIGLEGKGALALLNNGAKAQTSVTDANFAKAQRVLNEASSHVPASPPPSPAAFREKGPGGAVAAVPVVDGRWPIIAIYTLGYGTVE